MCCVLGWLVFSSLKVKVILDETYWFHNQLAFSTKSKEYHISAVFLFLKDEKKYYSFALSPIFMPQTAFKL